MIIAVSKLRSLCDRAISRLSHSSVRSMYVTANANTLTAAPAHTLDYTQHRGTDPRTSRGNAGSMKSLYFWLITCHFWHMCAGSGAAEQLSVVAAAHRPALGAATVSLCQVTSPCGVSQQNHRFKCCGRWVCPCVVPLCLHLFLHITGLYKPGRATPGYKVTLPN